MSAAKQCGSVDALDATGGEWSKKVVESLVGHMGKFFVKVFCESGVL